MTSTGIVTKTTMQIQVCNGASPDFAIHKGSFALTIHASRIPQAATKVRTNANTDSEIEAELIVLRKLNTIMAQVRHDDSIGVASLTISPTGEGKGAVRLP